MRAAAGNYETVVPKTACTTVLNAPSTASPANTVFGGGHTVQDASAFVAYSAGGALLSSLTTANTKTSQITKTCYTNATVPELQDVLDGTSTLSKVDPSVYANRQGYRTTPNGNCCPTCKKVVFAAACACAVPLPRADAGVGFKNTYQYPRTVT